MLWRAGRQASLSSERASPAKAEKAPVKSIYPDSKAADRRRPHAPPLFEHFKRNPLEQGGPASGPSQPVSKDSYILRYASTDSELKQLYTALGKAADTDDAVQATKLCQLIKERKQQIAGPSEDIVFEPQEKIVFLAVMRTLAHHGLLEETQAVHADMLSLGFEPCIDSLNHVLQAAIISGDEKATIATLESILTLSSSTLTASERSQELVGILLNDSDSSRQTDPDNAAGLTLPPPQVRNWNSVTFAHMVDHACQEHNLEYALLLFSTCYRMHLSLPHESLVRLIKACLHCEEFRTALELADLAEGGGLVYSEPSSKGTELSVLQTDAQSGQVARRFPPSIWLLILRSCAEGGYLPGVELAWSKAVTHGLLFPDDGTLHLILALAAKEGCSRLAYQCLRHIEPSFQLKGDSSTVSQEPIPVRRPSNRGQKMEEWHLAPLFEAQCTSHDYEAAMRTMREYHRRNFKITERATSRISTSIYPDSANLKLAREALERTATDPAIGTHKSVVNAVLTAAVWLGDLTQALEIYRAMDKYHPFPHPNSASTADSRFLMTPNLDTIHALLSGCIDAADYETGVQLLRDLNERRMRPNVVTFERMMVLCLTQNNYEAAFGFIEEAKEKDIPPSRKSYEALVRKCFREKDDRWESVLADMSESGYRPSPKMLYELNIEPDAFVHKPRRVRGPVR
uniref:Pentatricopeptide repeat-containing protein-mitochondrial domain-containing protein n=1 Tax=Kalmanozyma brasiliensis (strain GHG001) TaxID=1365824 RepID=V5EPS8_KALBG